MTADSRLFSGRQRRLVAFALAFSALLASAALLVVLVWALEWLVGRFANVLWPLAVAGILGLILRPLVDAFERRLRLRRLAAVILLYGLFLLLAGGILSLMAPRVIGQILDFAGYLPSLAEHATSYVQLHYPDWIALYHRFEAYPAVRGTVDALKGELNDVLAHLLPSLRAVGEGLLALVSVVTGLAVIPIYLFFFLLSRTEPTAKLGDHLPFLSPGAREDVVFLAREFVGIVVAFFRGQLLIGLSMGVLLATGFSLIGLRFGLFLGLAVGVLNIVPYLGTMVGLAVVLPLAFFQPDGGWKLLGLAVLVEVAVQIIEAFFLTPKIMGATTGLHPMVIIVAILFWGTALGGFLGILLAVPLTAFFATAWRLAKHKYFVPA